MLKEFLTKIRSEELGQSVLEYLLLITVIGATSVLMMTVAGLNVGRLLTSTFSLAQDAAAHLGKPLGH
ncbi:MAG: hypothetical protein HYR56_08925 [Acidobacteria bacterium]|nr:hypothetical protein [Acidobacteriota bacterium]MBI3424787.1 hypothetical protein [Acidobacteriota bacterium]